MFQGFGGIFALGMDEGEPGGVERSEGHVLPDVAVHEVRRRVERHQDHQRRVRHRPLHPKRSTSEALLFLG